MNDNCISVSYNEILKELSHGILIYFGHVQNYLKQTEGNLEIVIY